MRNTFTTVAAAAAVWAVVALPAAAQSSGSAGSGSSQQSGSASGSGATDQQGSTHGDQVGSGGTGQPGTGQSGTGSAPAGASGERSATGQSPGAKASAQDRTFIREAAAGGMAEVELGRLATRKASSSEVKAFAQMMVDDHTTATTQLQKIAQQEGLAPPSSLEPEAKATRDRLSKLSDEAFDRAYMDHMVKDHQNDVALFRRHSTAASSPEVKQFASSTLPTLEKHLDRAKEIQLTIGGDLPRGTTGSSSPEDSKEDKDGTDPGTSPQSGSTPPPQP